VNPLRRADLKARSNIALAVVDSKVLRGYPVSRKARIPRKAG